MKKIAFVLAVLLLAAPSWAAVTITATQVGDTNEVEISYSTDGTLPRAFGLDITVTDGNIVACTAAHVGECDATDQGYGIFPGTIVIEADGTVSDYNTPVAPSDDPGALGGLGTAGITVEMGSLYEDTNAPADSGVLCTIVVTESCTVNIAGNAARCGEGSEALGVVMENPDEVVIPTYIPGVVEFEDECIPSDHADYNEWLAVGKPNSWCNPRQCHGDADGLDEQYGFIRVWVGYNDVSMLVDGFRKTYGGDPTVDTWIAADFNHADEQYGFIRVRVGYDDVAVLLDYFRKTDVPEDCLD